MFTVCIIFILLILNLFKVVTEGSTIVYKDVRFWVVLTSLLGLITLTVQSFL